MHEFIKKHRKILLAILILLTTVIAVKEQFRAESSSRLVITTLSGKKPERFEVLRRIDSIPHSIQPYGNLFFSFKNFQNWNENGINTTAMIFQRSAYNIYPLQLYGNAGNFTPFDTVGKKEQEKFSMQEWIHKKNISHTLYFVRNPDKSVAMNIIQHAKVKPTPHSETKITIIILDIIISFICTAFFGLFIVSFIFKNAPKIEIASVAVLSGIGCSALIFQLFSMLGILPSPALLALLGISGVLGVYLRRGKLLKIITTSGSPDIDSQGRSIKFLKSLLLTLLIFVTVVILFNACFLELYAWDGFMIWLLKAKVVLHESLKETSFFTNRNYGFAHLKYPLLLPFIYASFSLLTGGFNLYSARSPEFFLFIAGAFLFYYIFRKESRSSIFAMLLMTSMFLSPVFLINCGVGVADALLSIFYCASIYYQFAFFRNGKRQDILLAIIFTALCAMTKNEGIALYGVSIVLFTFFSILLKPTGNSIKNSLFFALGTTLLVLPYFLWSSSLPATDENYPQHLSALLSMKKLSLLPGIFGKFITTMFSLKFLPPSLIAIFALATVKRTFFTSHLFWTRFIYFSLHFLMYILIFAVTPWNLSFLYNTALDRVILHLIPALLLLGATAYGYAGASKSDKNLNMRQE